MVNHAVQPDLAREMHASVARRGLAFAGFSLPSPLNHALDHATHAAKIPPILHRRMQHFHISIRTPQIDIQKASMWLTG
jgi:hypothetical protein